MNLILLTTLTVVSATTDIWTESSLVNVYADSAPTRGSDRNVRLYAARGERESFQICIEGGRKGLSVQEVRGEPLEEGFPAPEIRLVGYLETDSPSPRAYREGRRFPDPLLDPAPFDIPARETRAVWVTYEIPRDAKPGLHKGRIEIVPAKGPKRRVEVQVEVFDFELPDEPGLRTLFQLSRESICDTYGIADDPIEMWKPIYDGFSKHRLSYSVWTDGNLVKVGPEGNANADIFKAHLEYAVAAGHMSTVDVGMGEEGIGAFPVLPESAIQDPLQLYLLDLDKWLQERDWLRLAVIQPMPSQGAGDLQEARKAYFRVWRADKRLHRLVVGALHPSLERYTDLWAVPVRYYQPYAHERLLAGYSLRAEPAYPAEDIAASSAGGRGVYGFADTLPEEAYDGSLFTSWISAGTPTEDNPEWFRVDTVDPVQTTSLRIGWRPGLEPESIEIQTSVDGRIFNPATVRWEHHRAAHPFDQSWSECRFRSRKTFRAIELEFLSTAARSPVGITEIEFGRAPAPETIERIEPLELWTYSLDGDFPSLYADANPVEVRLVAWVGWGHRAQGFRYGELNLWPESWHAYAKEPPRTWSGGGDGRDFLFYPGPKGPVPSIRAERLRDGIEDYEYLKAMNEAIEKGAKAGPEIREWLARSLYTADIPPENLGSMAGKITGVRVAIGRALSAKEK